MFTLLPEDYKKRIVKDYRSRLTNVGLLLFIGAFFAGIILLIPSLAFVGSKKTELLSEKMLLETDIAEKNSNNLAEALSSIRTDLVVLQREEVSPTDFIKKIIGVKTPAIKINEIHYTLTEDTAGTFTISGLALLRKDLTSFTKSLETIPGVILVDLPISNLAKDANLPFTIQISFDTHPNEEEK